MIAACIEFHAVKTGLSGTLCKFGKELNKLGYFFNCQFAGNSFTWKIELRFRGFYRRRRVARTMLSVWLVPGSPVIELYKGRTSVFMNYL